MPLDSRECWLQTYTGRAFTPLSPKLEDIDIIDIGWALSNVCRYTGHTRRFYSVAEHCVHIARYLTTQRVPRSVALCGLLHDASEAYLADIASPVKPFLSNYAEIEHTLMCAIAERFAFPWPMPQLVKDADTRILMNEREALLGPPPLPWAIDAKPLPDIDVIGWAPSTAYVQFLTMFEFLVQA